MKQRDRHLPITLVGIALASTLATTAVADPTGRSLRVLHVMSYHAGWEWNRDQLAGFKEAMGDLAVEYRVLEMDTKRDGSEANKVRSGNEARQLVDAWKPDLVYTNDDNAQLYFAKDYVGAATPFVFSGVNAEPGTYGYTGRDNVTGVLEQEHGLQTVRLLRQIVPDLRRIAIIVDSGATWPGVVERLRASLAGEADIEIAAVDTIHTFAEYKERVLGYQGKVDAIGILGVFSYTDASGARVPYEEVLRWTAENSTLPDFSFWGDRVELGTLCAVRVSGLAQGRAAGEMARAILADGRAPSSIPIAPTVKGEPMVSLARARKLGLAIPSGILLNAKVVKGFRWDS
ncbi:MAG: hypothetical protein H6983_00685 [Ectothiorhodospiraceae bacterium]|nr:hypothetical protein [Ectothiorhodospiraceae bacterium]